MTSWVYLFSQFTPEALLFEAFFFLLLVCLYAAFWVLRKRRYGAVDANLPSGPVKSYLNELIANAEQIRVQLFGLLSSSDPLAAQRATLTTPSTATGLPPGGALVGDPDAINKLTQLELKFTEQAKTIELLNSEKTKLEGELAESRNAGPSSSNSSPSDGSNGDADTIAKLNQKIQDLEGRLAEYNVIEDDLANLKRLQQENTQLKAQLEGKGVSPAAVPTSAAPSAAPESPPSESQADATSAAQSIEAFETASPSPTEDVFESLAGQVDSSLQDSIEAAASPSSPAKNEAENAEADLVAEFEKMLKG